MCTAYIHAGSIHAYVQSACGFPYTVFRAGTKHTYMHAYIHTYIQAKSHPIGAAARKLRGNFSQIMVRNIYICMYVCRLYIHTCIQKNTHEYGVWVYACLYVLCVCVCVNLCICS